MEHSVEILFSQEVLNYFLDTYQLERNVKKLGDFENYVFEVYHEEKPFILRITHSTHRSEEHIAGELDWVNYLNKSNVNCPEVYPSVNGDYIVHIAAADGSIFYGCLFSKVKGYPVKVNSEEFNEQLFFAWGKTTGQMHAATKSYHRREDLKERPYWHEDELLEIEKYVPEEKEIIENTKQLLQELALLPQTKDNFGLIHTDIHSGNFFYDGESVYVFDFDDCSYIWFASDIAIPLYYSIYYRNEWVSEKERDAFANRFLTHFLKGYEVYHQLPDHLFEHLPLFLRLRDITLYAVLYKKIAPESRTEWVNLRLAEMRERIIKKQAIVNISQPTNESA